MGKSKAPEAPDPQETAAASTSTNVGTAIANAWLNNVNQVTPDGSLNYDQTGSYSWTDPYTGETYEIPTFTATQTLSEQQQAIKDQTDAAELNLAGLANQQSGFLQDYMATPFSYEAGDHESWALNLYNQLNSDTLSQQEANLRTTLANKGIREGSAAYDAAMKSLYSGQQNAQNQFLLDSYNTGLNTALTTRNQPINEITALLSGSQISQPNFVNTGSSTIPTTDVAGIINQNYQNQLSAYQQNQSGLGGLISGLGSLGGALIGLSDERAKKDVEKRGEIDGMGIYDFHYKGEPEGAPKHTGLMAQEVAKTKPEAVLDTPSGLMAVNYTEALKRKPKGKSVPKIRRKR